MKKAGLVTLIMILVLCFAVPVMAHEGWSQTNRPIVELGEVSYVELLFGNHSNHHASYRIEGNWNMDKATVFVVNDAGQRVDISETLFYTGELTESEHTGINNYYVASFSSATPGIYVISVEGESSFTSGGLSNHTLRSAKSFTAVNDIPMLAFVEEFEGYEQQVSKDRAEFIPLFNPTAVTLEQEVELQYLIEGEPAADVEVSLIRRSTSEAERFTTDEEGIIRFVTGAADYYLVRAYTTVEDGLEGEYDRINYESTLTFTVQNGTGLSVEEVGQLLGASSDLDSEESDLTDQESNLESGEQEEEAPQSSVADGEADAPNAYLFISILVIFLIIITLTLLVSRRNKSR